MEAKKEIEEFDPIRAGLDAIAKESDFDPDCSTEDGYKKSKQLSLKITKVMSKLETTRKELKADALEYGRRVDGQAKTIREELEEMRGPHKEAYQAIDREKKLREERRLADQQRRVDEIANMPNLMIDSDSAGIAQCIEDLKLNACEGFYEHTEAALLARKDALSRLESMFESKKRTEEQAVELARLKKEREAEEARRAEERAIEAEKQREIERIRAEQDEERRKEREMFEAETARMKADAEQARRDFEELQAKHARLEAEEDEPEMAIDKTFTPTEEEKQIVFESVVVMPTEPNFITLDMDQGDALTLLGALHNTIAHIESDHIHVGDSGYTIEQYDVLKRVCQFIEGEIE